MTQAVLSSDAKHLLHTQSYLVDNPRAHLLLLHGAKSDSQSLAPIAYACQKIGVACVAFDYLGHGQSAKAHRLGKIHNKHARAHLLQDAWRMLPRHTPIFVYGEDLGAALAINLLAHHSHTIDGAIICDTPTQVPSKFYDLPSQRALASLYKDAHDIHTWRNIACPVRFIGTSPRIVPPFKISNTPLLNEIYTHICALR